MSKKVGTENLVLSIVIASQNACASVTECLREIENQCAGVNTEIVVVDNSTDGTAEIIDAKFSSVRLIRSAPEKLIPELWGIGITETTGELIALTTTHFVPGQNWITEIIKAHESSFDGIGGAIENDSHAEIVFWAVYFCRYSHYMLPFPQQNSDDFAADNASYKRASLESVRDSMKDGFWETFVHRAMLKKKLTLALSPQIIVYHQDSFTFGGFIRQRFAHGIQFGETRTAEITSARRALLILLSPLIPFLYLYRISRRVFYKKRNIQKYLLSLPILFLFLVSWAVGECYGYIVGRKKSDGYQHSLSSNAPDES